METKEILNQLESYLNKFRNADKLKPKEWNAAMYYLADTMTRFISEQKTLYDMLQTIWISSNCATKDMVILSLELLISLYKIPTPTQ